MPRFVHLLVALCTLLSLTLIGGGKQAGLHVAYAEEQPVANHTPTGGAVPAAGCSTPQNAAYIRAGQAVSGSASIIADDPSEDDEGETMDLVVSFSGVTIAHVTAFNDVQTFNFTAAQDGSIIACLTGDLDGDEFQSIQVQVAGDPIKPDEGQCNPSEPAVSAAQDACGDPITTATGAFWHTFQDLSIPGRGFPLTFSHTYSSSAAATNGPLGYGWTFNWGMSLQQDSGTGDVTIRQESGSTVSFKKTGSGYTAPMRVLATLVKNGDGTFTFTRRAGEIFTFSATGQLTKEQDLNGYATTLAYNTSGQLTSITDPAKRSLTLAYSGSRLASVTDPAGRQVQFAYDPQGNLQTVTDVARGVTSFTYDANHRLLTMTNPRGTVVQNVYDTAGRVTSQTVDPTTPTHSGLNRTTTLVYANNPDGTKTTTITNPAGVVRAEVYYNGLKVAETRGLGSGLDGTWRYEYDLGTYRPVSITGPMGAVTRASYDDRGNPLVITDPLGRQTIYTYDTLNHLTSVTDGTNIKTTLTYDARGNALTRSRPLANTNQTATITYHYDDAAHPGGVTSITDANGGVWRYTYDTNGDTASATDPPGNRTTYGYNGIGWLTSVTSPRGNVAGANPAAFTTTIDHNAFGDVTTVTDPLGHMTTRHYDADRNLDRVTNGRNKPAQYDYDAADELIKLTRPDGSTVKREYRGDGAVTAFVDGANQRTSFTYDARGRTSGITDPLHHTATAGFDPADRLLYIDDPGVRSAYYTYDQADQLKGIFYTGYASLSASIKTGWNLLDPWAMSPGGSLSSLVDDLNTALGADTAVKATAVYQNGRFQLYVPGYSEDIDYQPSQGVFVLSTASGTWSSQNATNSTPSTSPLTPGWNLLAVPVPSSGINAGALSSQLAPACGLQEIAVYQNGSYKTYFPGKSADFHIPATSGMWVLCSRTAYWTLQTDDPNITNITYDNDGRRIAMNDGTGTSSWTYDSLGRLTQSRDGAGSVVSYGYDLGNNLTSITYPGSHAVTRSFDAAGRLHTVADWLGHTSTFDYDADGNLTTQTLPAAAGVVDTFGYDNADRLMNIAAAMAGTTLASFTYGRNEDNLLTSSQATGVTQPAETYTYTALDQLQGVNSASYGYDAADNITQLPSGATLQYNAAHQLTGMTQGPTTTQYAYDGVGSRISQTPTGGSAVTYAYDSARNLTDYNSVASYIYNGDGLRMSKTVGGATQAFVWDAAEALPLLLQDGATSYVYGPNGLPLEQIASNGSVLYYHHDQLGSTRLLTDSVGTVAATYTYDAFGKQTAKTGSISNPFGYAGAYTDAESGLQYLRNRYYDPNTGQFLTVDPLVRQTLTPYSYAQNSPLNFVDPAGLDWWNPLTWFDSPSQAEQAAQDAKQINSDRKSLQQAVDNIENNARKVADAYEAAKDGKLLEFGTECAREKALKDAQSQLGARNEYKNLMDEQDANKEATKSLWDKVKSLWDGSSDALAGQTGSNSPSTSQNSSGTPPSSRPQLREFQAP